MPVKFTVGKLRHSTAYCEPDRPVVIVSEDASLDGLEVVDFYPDTIDSKGNWNVPQFKIKVKRHASES